MGRSPRWDDNGLKKGPWTQEEDEKLITYIQKHGHGSWRALPKNAGLNRCGKSCRLRWTNYLRPDIKRGRFSQEEEQTIIKLHSVLGNKWSRIAAHLPGRTDNEIKNYWNTHLRKKLLQMGIDPITHRPRTDLNLLANLSLLLSLPLNSYPYDINALRLQSNAAELAKLQVLQSIIQLLSSSSAPSIDHSSAALLGLSPLSNNQQLIEKLLACPNGTKPTSVGASFPTRSETEQYGAGFGNCSQKMNSFEPGSSGHGALAEDKLPGLVPDSSTETLSVNDNIASNNNFIHGSIQPLPDCDFLEGWEKLIDDGTSDFFWTDLLN